MCGGEYWIIILIDFCSEMVLGLDRKAKRLVHFWRGHPPPVERMFEQNSLDFCTRLFIHWERIPYVASLERSFRVF